LLAAEPGKFPAPAKVTNPTKEADLATLTLTPEAEKRLGIETATVERRKLNRTRLFGGEIILPARQNGVGTNASSGQSVFTILPSLSPAELVRLAQSQIDADGQVEQAKVQLDAAKVALARAEQLVRDKAGTVRSVDDARAQVSLAEAGLRTAQARRELLGPPVLDVSNPQICWVRVPVYVGETAKLDSNAETRVGGLAGAAATSTRPAKPVSAPPSANAAAATVDWFYEVTNQDGAFRLGQRVGVNIPLRTDEESLVVPWTAVVHDVQGGAWVYEKSGPQGYTRRRVQVKQVVGEFAALAGGVKPGASVVITGVAELFGTEFGAGK
jgi:multidrug efflux pump subunit AcrA (membrane-fusion protein)